MKLIISSNRYSVIDVDPEDLAAQLTLIDLPIFKSIKMEELILSSRQRGSANVHSKKTSVQHLCPNLAAMKRQFNQVTFWVVAQVLSLDTPRQRAELISHLIRTARSLYQLNNLHSSNAVVSALLSSPIYRLEKTWHSVNKKYPKEKSQFVWLRDLYSDTNNYELLRNHLITCDLPCIPYLGVYSRDIIYINEAHQEGTLQRTQSTSRILQSIQRFQSSEYDNLVHMPHVHNCLLSARYIDELQKFVEDQNYKRSLDLEPPGDCPNNGSHYHTLAIDQVPPDIGTLHQSLSSSSIARNFANISSQSNQRRTNMLAGLTSMVHSAVLSTSHRLSGQPVRSLSPPKLAISSANPSKPMKYLIDDSYVHHNSEEKNYEPMPQPISTSS